MKDVQANFNIRTQPVDFLYKLVTPEGTFQLKYSPIGWKEYGTAWERHKEGYGYGRKFIVKLQFVGDGYDLMRAEYEKYDIEANVQLEIHKLDRQEYIYSLDFVGDVDFSNVKDNMFDGGIFDVQINEAGFAKMLSARSKDTFEIKLPDTILIDQPANAWQECEWDIYVERHTYENSVAYYNIGNSDISSHLLQALQPQPIHDWFPYHSVPDHDAFKGYANPILKFRKYNDKLEPLTLKFEFDGSFKIENDTPGDDPEGNFSAWVGIWEVDENGDITHEVEEIEYPFVYAPVQYGDYPNIHFSFEKRLTFECAITLRFCQGEGGTDEYGSSLLTQGKFTMKGWSEQLLDPFPIKAIRAYDVFLELVDKIKGDVSIASVQSNILDTGILKNVYLTSGDAVRGIDGAVLKTSFNDFFESLDAVVGVAMFIYPSTDYPNTYKSVISLEKYADAFRDEEILNLGKVKNLSISPYRDAIFNYIKVGSEDRDYEAANGRFEFNTLNEFSLPITRISNERVFVGAYRTDSFGITDLRLSYKQKSTASSDSDNSVFMIHTMMSGGNRVPYSLQKIDGDEMQVLRKGIFNLFFTPKRCLMRQEGRIASVLQKSMNPVATYQTTAKSDANLTSQLLGDPMYADASAIIERSDYRIDLSKAIFWAKMYEFTARVPVNLATLMSQKIGGYVSFEYQGKKYKGFPYYVSESPPTNSAQEIQLIAYPGNPDPINGQNDAMDWFHM